jgi:hypothetical protein
MARKRKRRHAPGDGEELAAPSGDQTPVSKDHRPVADEDQLDDLGDRVQARVDADIGLDHSLPPDVLRPIGKLAILLGLAGLALTVPADWLTWSRLLVTSVGASVAGVAATAAIGNRNCETVSFSGGLLFALAVIKWIGLPALLGPGPGGVFLVGSACVYAVGALAWAGSRSGPAALLAREVEFVKLAESFQDELAALRAGDPDARAPVVLQCRRCGVVFAFHADRIKMSPISIGTLNGLNRAWMDINRCGPNFECRIEEPATCPRCESTDDYVYAEHPAISLRDVVEAQPSPAHRSGAVVHAHLSFAGTGPLGPVLERWVQLRDALEEEEDAVGPRLELAQLYRWLRLGGLARENCERVLDLDPKNVSAWTLMSDLMRDRGEEEAARMLLADAVLSEGDPIRRLMDHPELQAALMGLPRRGRGRRRR